MFSVRLAWLGVGTVLLFTGIDPAEGSVYTPWLRRPSSPLHYQFNQDEYGWLFAHENCKAQNAQLIVFEDDDELTWVLSHYNRTGTTRGTHYRLMLGYVKDAANNWAWLDGSGFTTNRLEFKDISVLEQSHRCSEMEIPELRHDLNKLYLHDINCNSRVFKNERRYVCKRSMDAFNYVASVDGHNRAPIDSEEP